MPSKPGKFQWILDKHLPALKECRICPRNCGTDRQSGKTGFCGSDAGFNISSICLHTGEEPAIGGEKGICNIFFSRCNLSCKYCQNWQISCTADEVPYISMTLEDVLSEIIRFLDQGCKAVGFVSPSHFIPHVRIIIDSLRSLGRTPVFVYNTNCYDNAEEIVKMESYIDVYLPDFKYADNRLANLYSGANNYREKALSAIKEMYRQKGSTLLLDEAGQAIRGLVIRHLILPGNIQNSLEALNLLADELSESVTLSLMSQYWPTQNVSGHPELGRTITREENDTVVEEMERLGFYKGWVQQLESSEFYLPDFKKEDPFGNK